MKIGQLNGLNLEDVPVGSGNERRCCWKFIKITFRSTNASPKGFGVSKDAHKAVQLTNLSTPVVRTKSPVKTGDNKRRIVGDHPK